MASFQKNGAYAYLIVAVAAAVGFIAAIVDYFTTGSGIDGTGGALLVVGSSALIVMAALLMATRWLDRVGWLRTTLLVLLLLGILGTALAAYMLESPWLVAAMVVSLIGWIAAIVSNERGHHHTGASASVSALALLLIAAPHARAQDWSTFNGDLRADKYATADQITPENVHNLAKAWEVHTGDVSDGSDPNGPKASDWGATPLFVNNTLYVSTPFDRIFAVEPDTGKVKWTFDTHIKLVDPTQGELKNRGLSYWAAATPVAGQACQKIVYLGTMDGKVFAVDADSGGRCPSSSRLPSTRTSCSSAGPGRTGRRPCSPRVRCLRWIARPAS
jgi:quinoprotein glucose dehydrogenase